ncbi:hypothetical protein AAVH_27141, partial [Aphelenchoides avenae]
MEENGGIPTEAPASRAPSAPHGSKKRKADGDLEMPVEDMMTVPASRLFDLERSVQRLSELNIGAGTSDDATKLDEHVKAVQLLIRDAKPLRQETLGFSKPNAMQTVFTKPKEPVSLVEYSDSETDDGSEENIRN